MRNIKIILSALVVSFFATSCMVEDETMEYGNSPYVVGFINGVTTESYFVDEGPVTKTYPVDIIGGSDGTATQEDIVINYEIDPASTATEGEEFNFLDDSGTLTIPAGSSFAEFPLQINTGGLDPDQPTELILHLSSTTTDGAVVSAINDDLSITFVGCQSFLEGSYTSTAVSGTVTFTNITPVEYEISALPYLTAGGANIAFMATDICGEIVIDSPVLGGGYQAVGEGTVNADGSVTITYALFQGSALAFDFRQQPATYIPQ